MSAHWTSAIIPNRNEDDVCCVAKAAEVGAVAVRRSPAAKKLVVRDRSKSEVKNMDLATAVLPVAHFVHLRLVVSSGHGQCNKPTAREIVTDSPPLTSSMRLFTDWGKSKILLGWVRCSSALATLCKWWLAFLFPRQLRGASEQ